MLCRVLELDSVHAVVSAIVFAEMGVDTTDLCQFPHDLLTHILFLTRPFSARNVALMAGAFPIPPSVLLGGWHVVWETKPI